MKTRYPTLCKPYPYLLEVPSKRRYLEAIRNLSDERLRVELEFDACFKLKGKAAQRRQAAYKARMNHIDEEIREAKSYLDSIKASS